jgi:glycosyltransferase involved in cell wall biosynthesis
VTQIAILMAVRNGANFLPEQLASIARQSHANWRLFASDDGSTDQSIGILRQFAAACPDGQVRIEHGPQAGVTAHFRQLIRRHAGSAEAVAFCDQDDVWEADHFARALARMGDPQSPVPWIGGGRMILGAADLRQTGLSPLPRRPLGFGNALVQNVLSGNTMVMNASSARLLAQAEAEAGDFVLHDWWAYQVVTGAGGVADFDPRPRLIYRQHQANVVGANQGLGALRRRLSRHLSGDYGQWHRRNATALAASAHRFTHDNQRALAAFSRGLEAGLPGRLRAFRDAGVYHQRRRATLIFWLSALMGLV